MLRTLILLTYLVISLGSFAQSKGMLSNAYDQQLKDLENGVVLIPLEREPGSAGIASSRDPELMRIREKNKSLIKASQSSFDFTDVAYYWSDDHEDLFSPESRANVLMDAGLNSVSIDLTSERIFLLHIHQPDENFASEVRLRKTTRKGTEESDRSTDVNPYTVKVEKANVRIDQLKEELETAKSSDEPGRVQSIQSEIDELEELVSSYAFEKEYNYFSSANPKFASLVIRRLLPDELVHNKRKTYYFNFRYTSRLHSTEDSRTAFREAFMQMNRQLDKEMQELRDKESKLEKLRNSR